MYLTLTVLVQNVCIKIRRDNGGVNAIILGLFYHVRINTGKTVLVQHACITVTAIITVKTDHSRAIINQQFWIIKIMIHEVLIDIVVDAGLSNIVRCRHMSSTITNVAIVICTG